KDLEEFADLLDRNLQKVNSDYEAKRYKGIFIDRLELTEAPKGTFNQRLKQKGKLGGQHKIPRLSNSRTYYEELLQIIGTK
ncbi:MAG: GH3 auxin-responsive promoter family protein, partial [Bacteroidales bacterium]|nr:GH3 auxin-responsive promoter family protein [Bacteroidales bacterium]